MARCPNDLSRSTRCRSSRIPTEAARFGRSRIMTARADGRQSREAVATPWCHRAESRESPAHRSVDIVVDDLAAATAFFVELVPKLPGKGRVEGSWVDRAVGIERVRVDAAMLETPDCHGRLELMKFHAPSPRATERASEHPRYPPCRIPGRRQDSRGRRFASPQCRARRRGGALPRATGSATSAPRRDHRHTCSADRLRAPAQTIASPASVVVPEQDPLRASSHRHEALPNTRSGRPEHRSPTARTTG